MPDHFKIIDTKQNVAEDIKKVFGGSAKLTDREKEIIQKAQNEMDALQKAGKLTPVEKNRILFQACTDIALSPANAKESSNLISDIVVHFGSKSTEDFWNRTDDFFEDHWWQDPQKLEIAARMLELEAKAKGKIDISEQSAYLPSE